MINYNSIFQSRCLDVQAICNDMLNKSGIQFFDYARMFDDGSCYVLSNSSKVIDYLFENESPMFAPIPANVIREDFVYYIPEDGPYQKVMHDMKEYFNISHAFDIFEVDNGYVDVCCFATSADNNEIINYFFNNIEYLKDFLSHFKKEASTLISSMDDNRLQLPDKMRLNFNSTVRAPADKTRVLSHQQKQCLSCLMQGMTIKEIANYLKLSPRTVEHYIDAIKSKLHCSSRSKLIMKALELGLLEKN